MFFSINRQSVALAGVMTLAAWSAQAQGDVKEVAIDFEAWVGEEEFFCGESYDDVGTANSTIAPQDLRFYVSELALIDDAGNAVPVELEQDGTWQHQNVALLDFEDGCNNGTAELNTTVVGTVPEGDYQSLQFTLGVPQNLNHDDAAIAPSPLNLTSMWWNWQGGYKFLRLDLETDQVIANVGSSTNTTHGGNVQSHQQTTTSGNGSSSSSQTTIQTGSGSSSSSQSSSQTTIVNGQTTQSSSTHSSSGNGSTHSSHSSHINSNNKSYLVHLGSTGCGDSAQSPLFGCANPNRVQVVLDDFNPDKDVVIADLGELLAASDLSQNQANTPNGCMSDPSDGDCAPILETLSLAPGATEQYFFFVE